MARIRSVHPSFFTDEAIVGLQAQAQVFLIGLWTDCDDQGVFEWKPVGLKIRLLPATNVDVAALLGELKAANVIRMVEVGGRKYGLVRNFRKFQRPKKPNSTHPLSQEFRTYVGLDGGEGGTGGEPPPPSSPPGSENPPQMEDGGGREGDSSEAKASGAKPPPDVASVIFGSGLDWLMEATGKKRGDCAKLLGKWRKTLGDEGLIATLGKAQREASIDPIGWMEGAVKARRPAAGKESWDARLP